MRAEAGKEEAQIEHALVAPGHDGAAELLLRIRHGNGARDTVTLDAAAAERLLDHCGANDIEQLVGHSWRRLLHALDESGA